MQDVEAIYKEYSSIVYRYLVSLCGDTELAMELTQEVFYRAIKNIHKFKGDCKMSTWLCQIGKYTWYQYLQKKKIRNEVPLDEADGSSCDKSSLEDQLISGEQKIEVYKQIQCLDQSTKDVMMMRLTGDLSFKEIGLILDKSENWARVTYYRGKQKIVKGG